MRAAAHLVHVSDAAGKPAVDRGHAPGRGPSREDPRCHDAACLGRVDPRRDPRIRSRARDRQRIDSHLRLRRPDHWRSRDLDEGPHHRDWRSRHRNGCRYAPRLPAALGRARGARVDRRRPRQDAVRGRRSGLRRRHLVPERRPRSSTTRTADSRATSTISRPPRGTSSTRRTTTSRS